MKILLRFVNSLLAISLIIAALCLALSQIFTFQRVTKAADDSGAYPVLAQALPVQMATDSAKGDVALQQQLTTALGQVVTPDYIQNKFDNFFEQLDLLLRGEGDSASIDFSDLRAQLKQKGIDMPADQIQPLVVKREQVGGLTSSITISKRLGFDAAIVTAVLLVVSLLLSYLVGNYRSLGLTLLVAGVIYGLLILLISAIIGSTANNLKLDGPMQVLAPPLQKFLTTLGLQLRTEFGILAIVISAVGILLLIFSGLLPKKSAKPPKLSKKLAKETF